MLLFFFGMLLLVTAQLLIRGRAFFIKKMFLHVLLLTLLASIYVIFHLLNYFGLCMFSTCLCIQSSRVGLYAGWRLITKHQLESVVISTATRHAFKQIFIQYSFRRGRQWCTHSLQKSFCIIFFPLETFVSKKSPEVFWCKFSATILCSAVESAASVILPFVSLLSLFVNAWM